MQERLDRLEDTLQRIGRELDEVRATLRELREPPSPGASAVPETAVPTSRIDQVHAAFTQRTSDPPPAPDSARAPGPADARAGSSWDHVLRSLGTAPPAQPPSTRLPAPGYRGGERRGLEDLIGRYGTIAFATLTILLGVGALLGWAIRNGYITPPLRVAMGLVLAIGLAVAGWRIRRGDSPRYGNALLALALAVTHVVAWGAGPKLHLMPEPLVLALAALASSALAWLAWREDDQLLFNVGFGGALLAPFVTSSGGGNAVLLLSYGFLVLGAGIASLGQREWSKTPLVTSIGLLTYTAVAADMVDQSGRWTVAHMPSVFALGLGGLGIVLLDGLKRMAISYPALIAATGALIAATMGPAPDAPQFVLAVVLAISTWFAGDREHRGLRTAALAALLVPLGAAGIALSAVESATSLTGSGTALLFGGLCAAAAWRNANGEQRTWAFTATLLAGLAIGLSTDNRTVLFCVLIAAFAVGAQYVGARLVQPGIVVAALIWLLLGTAFMFDSIGDRTAYAYTPFFTPESVAGLGISAAWLHLSWHVSRTIDPASVFAQELPRSAIRLIGALVAFLWIREELARAVSPDVSGFLLVAYYAATGIASIFLGRARELPLLRQIGLGLSLFGAVTSITQASSLAIGWRVGSYLLTGGFLLAVAWSYRVTRAGDGTDDELASHSPGSADTR